MKRALSVAILSTLFSTFATFATAQPYTIELDLDGILGNGPDTLSATVGDYIDVDVWIFGEGEDLIGADFSICNANGSLEFQSFVPVDVASWSNWMGNTGPGCRKIQAGTFSGVPVLTVPFLHGVVTYRCAVDATISSIAIDLDPLASDWFTSSLARGPFDSFVGASVIVGATAIEENDWGAIKTLFR